MDTSFVVVSKTYLSNLRSQRLSFLKNFILEVLVLGFILKVLMLFELLYLHLDIDFRIATDGFSTLCIFVERHLHTVSLFLEFIVSFID